MKKLVFIIFIFFTYTFAAHASEVSVVVPKTINDTHPFTASIDLQTDGISINSFDIRIAYPKDIISFKGYKEDGSIKKLWLVSPKEESGEIHFSGIIPGGVDGVYNPDKSGLQAIPLVALLFSAKDNGEGEFAIIHSDILQNDGRGTSLTHEAKNASITISSIATSLSEKPTSMDRELPEPFTIIYAPASFFSKTPSMIIFSTADKDSGIEKYQLKGSSNIWKDVVSPSPIPRALLMRAITVRAVDFSGNIRESEIQIPGVLSPLQLLLIILLGIVCYFIFFMIKRKR